MKTNIQIDIAGFRETMATELQQWGNVVWVDDFWGKIKKQESARPRIHHDEERHHTDEERHHTRWE